ncbi:MAG: transglutaminaseTgpA domain-containing protein, partial [Natronospirillum sp.]
TAMPIHGPQLNAVQWQRVLLSLLLVQAMLLLPVVLMLPSWLVLVPVVTGYWQWQVIRGRRRTLPRVIRWMLALGLPPLLWLDGLHPGALDFYVSLAFIGVALKLIEMRTYRDAFLVAMMALFVLAALLLLDQSIVFTLYVFAGASIALSALVRLHAPQGMGFMQTWRASGGALAIAAPFMLLLFVIFPRLPPVWQIPAASDMARTGLSETLAPGEIARLVQSDELVFRASFQSTEPAREDLYWRAMTLHHFDGRRWYQWDGSTGIPRRLVSAPQLPRAQANSAEWIYELALAATHQPWLATLEHLTEFSGGEVVWLADQRLAWPDNITQAQGLTVRSARHVTARTEVNDALRQAALQLPGQGNAQARALATGWLEEVDGNAQAFAERVMRHFAAEPFRYSLRPGRSGDLDNAIDRFLFTSQSGFCAHYAESMVFMARAAGIPARIVTGYLGGQWSSDGEYLVVRSQEAHAWAELWIDGAGWVRFDPTLMVAPDRIDLALSGVLQEEGDLRPAAWSDNAAPSWLQALYWR